MQNWVCTKRMAARDGEDQTTGMFWRLFSYIQGANQEEAKIPMTTPVTTSVTPTPEVRILLQKGEKMVDKKGYFYSSIPAPSCLSLSFKRTVQSNEIGLNVVTLWIEGFS